MGGFFQTIILVGAGGAVGAGLRYASIVAAVTLFGAAFPWGTLFVNLAGSFVIGIAAALVRHLGDVTPAWQAFLMPGLLGGFTTFSAFSLDIFTIIERGQNWAAAAYILASVLGGLGALVAGFALVRGLSS